MLKDCSAVKIKMKDKNCQVDFSNYLCFVIRFVTHCYLKAYVGNVYKI